ncbi:MAG: transcriptional regulator [Deltaproteobacteria bacterium]|nr:transcriptional regulator [Deltaproteobacteria bacterium]
MTTGTTGGGAGGSSGAGGAGAAGTAASAPGKATKVIKRYANRKLYDTERSCYVTLDEISQMIKDGDDVKVVDNKSKDDLTAVTLAQILVEEEKKVAKMPLKLLRSIIQSGNEAVTDFYEKRVADPVKSFKDDVERRVESLLKRDGKGDAKAGADDASAGERPGERPGEHAGEQDEVKAGVVRELVSGTTEAFESWQRRIDERVREAMQKMTPQRPDLEAMRARIEALEARIRAVEAKRKG